jgi:hypothetical protein
MRNQDKGMKSYILLPIFLYKFTLDLFSMVVIVVWFFTYLRSCSGLLSTL